MSVPGNLYTPTIRKTRGGDYLIEQSLLFDGTSTYLNRTPSTVGNRKTWTFSVWVKRGDIPAVARTILGCGATSADDTLFGFGFSGSGDELKLLARTSSTTVVNVFTAAQFRDPNAWLHTVVAVDTTEATASNRVKMWVNGTAQSLTHTTSPALNSDVQFNNTAATYLGKARTDLTTNLFNGLMALPILVDGAALDPTSFGELDDDGYWNPIGFEGATTVDLVPGSEGTLIGNMTSGGGLAAAFDGTVNVASAEARVSGATGTVGKQWSSAKTITQYVVKSPSDDNFGGSSPITIKLQGSNDGSAWTDLHTDSGVGNTGTAKVQVVTSGITTSTAYTYHRIEISGGGAGTTNCAEVEFYEDTANSFGTNGGVYDFADTGYFGKAQNETGTVTVSSSGEWSGDTGNWTLTGDDASAGVVTSAIYSSELTGDFFVKMTMSGGSTSNRVGIVASSEIGTLTTTAEANDYGMANMTDSFYANFGTSQFVYGGSNQSSMSPNGDGVITLQRQSDTILITVDDGQDSHIFTQTFSGAMRIVLAGNSARAFNDMFWFDDLVFPFYDTSGFTSTDQLADSPTDDADLEIGNYATLNPLTKQVHVTLANGNQNITASDLTVAGNSCAATIGSLNTGKWFWFASLPSFGADSGCGVYDNDLDFGSLSPNSGSINNYGAGLDTTTAMRRFAGGTSVSPDVSLGFTADLSNDYQVYALDADNGYFWAGIYDASANTIYWIDWPNSDMTGDPTDGGTTGVSISGDNWTPFAWTTSSSASGINIYFDHADFPGAVPTGYSAIATQNLPAVAVSNPKDHFDVVTDAGADIKDTAFATFASNDCIAWIKDYANAQNWQFVDSVRGTSVAFSQHTTTAQAAYSAPSGTSIAYVWKAGTGGGVSNTDGSITATVSANTTAGVSIVYVNAAGTGAAATIGHGLGQAPALIIGKRLDSTGTCRMYHQKIGATKSLAFDASAPSTSSAYWNDTAPTSTVFTVGSSSDVNASGGTYVFYCFAEVPGFSVFDTYVGNASTNGPFMYADFKPAMSMEFNIAGGDNWFLHDEARHTTTLWDYELAPNTTSAHSFRSGGVQRIYANGAKITQSSNAFNPSGGTCIRIAFGSAAFAGGSTNITQGRAAY